MNLDDLTVTFTGVPSISINNDCYELDFSREAQAEVERLPFVVLLNLWNASGTSNMSELKGNAYMSAVFQRLVRAEVVHLRSGGEIQVQDDANSREQSPASAYAVSKQVRNHSP